MSPSVENLPRDYAAAMEDYLAGGGERALRRAYELGRRAVSQGVGILEIVSIHQTWAASAGGEAAAAKAATKFLAECLSPFEMALRSFQGLLRDGTTATRAEKEGTSLLTGHERS